MGVVKKFFCMVLSAVVLFAGVSCSKDIRIKRISEETLKTALNEKLRWTGGRNNDYMEINNYAFFVQNGDTSEQVTAPYYLFGIEWAGNDPYVSISYTRFSSEEEADHCFYCYLAAYAEGTNKEQVYHEGEDGYFFDKDNSGGFSAVYYSGDVIIMASSYDKEGMKVLKEMLKSLELPV